MQRVALALCCVAIAGCGAGGATPAPRSERAAPADRFDADAAFAEIERQVGYGQRPAGSEPLRALAATIREREPGWHYEKVPGWPRLRNIRTVVKGRRPALVIGAHYDTLVKPEGFVGANNGAAGSAIVMQLAEETARLKRGRKAREIRFVLFDGEEPDEGLPEESTNFYRDGLRGSKAYVRRHKRKLGTMVLLDYVANKGLQLPEEGTSSPGVWADILDAAKAAGTLSYFPIRRGVFITDDHTPFLKAGIPAADLIDWDYVGHGHTLEDGLDQLAVESVDAVGETISRYISRWRPPPKRQR